MRVSSFKVSNYRSIDSAEVDLADLTCLVGPNNEGKSNLLRALGLALNVVVDPDYLRRSRVWTTLRNDPSNIAYDARTDRPVGCSNRTLTTVTIRFELTDSECEAFRQEIGHSLNGDLPVQVQFTTQGAASVQIKKQRVGPQLTDKAPSVGVFIQQRLTFQYVPAIRTAEDAETVITQLIRRRLAALRFDQAYAEAQELIAQKSQSALASVETDLMEVLPRFLPSVAGVTIESAPSRTQGRADVGVRSILIDDGAVTGLDAKGSGVQSLAALALLRYRPDERQSDRFSILALEEPEAHLHSGASRMSGV